MIMEMMSTHIKDLVLKFYQETPFNFRQTVKEQADEALNHLQKLEDSLI